jgi:diguanylate cyclase (GGDEF)-like protein
LLGLVQQAGTVARIGGDEFVLLVSDLAESAEQGAMHLAQRCIDAIALPLRWRTVDTVIGVSIGIALGSGETSSQDLLGAADQAMYQAKHRGGGCYAVARTPIR